MPQHPCSNSLAAPATGIQNVEVTWQKKNVNISLHRNNTPTNGFVCAP